MRLWLNCKTPRATVPNFGRTDPRIRKAARNGGPEHLASRFNVREAAVPRPE
jgi:hypothetical protein